MNTTVITSRGAAATTFEETLKKADLNWEPKEDQAAGLDTGIVMPRKKLLYRSDNHQALGIVGSDYEASSPKAFLKNAFEFAEFAKGHVKQAGFIPDRSRAFAFVELREKINLPRELRKVGDPVACYIYTTDGWDGGTPNRARLYLERLKCANGMVSKEIAGDLWVSHAKGKEERYSARWKNFLETVRVTVASYQEQFIQLAKTRMTEAEAKAFLEKLIPGENTVSENRRTNLLTLFKTGTGNEGATRWDAYNAVTEFVTHQRTYRKSDSVSVETNRFLGVLETDTLSRTALNLLLN